MAAVELSEKMQSDLIDCWVRLTFTNVVLSFRTLTSHSQTWRRSYFAFGSSAWLSAGEERTDRWKVAWKFGPCASDQDQNPQHYVCAIQSRDQIRMDHLQPDQQSQMFGKASTRTWCSHSDGVPGSASEAAAAWAGNGDDGRIYGITSLWTLCASMVWCQLLKYGSCRFSVDCAESLRRGEDGGQRETSSIASVGLWSP